MTDRMIGAIEESLQSFSTNGIRWTAKTLTDRGRGAQETVYGADFMGVLDIALGDFTVRKGFLAQAKRSGPLGKREMDALHGQCDKMLSLTADSFVFVYGADGIDVIPAISVLGSSMPLEQHYKRSAQRFFEEHLECFIGDRAVSAASPNVLVALREKFRARSALLISAENTLYLPDEWAG